MLSFFSKKWKQAQDWIKSASLQAIKQSLTKKEKIEEPSCRILCLDDDRSFCQFINRLSHSLGIQLDEAYSIEEAKRATENYPNYQAFIVDGHLPDGSGFQFVAWLREKKKLNAPVGFISRIYQDSKSFRILKEGLKVDYVLEKPIRPTEVQQLLMQLCQIKSQLPSSEPLEAILEDLKVSYEKTISDKVERLEKLILAVQKDPDIDNLQALKNEVHKIAGSAGTYGYIAVSDLCKKLEMDLIEQIELAKQGHLNHQWLFSLDEFFTQIKLHFQIEILGSHVQNIMKTRYLSSIYIVDEDEAFLKKFHHLQSDLCFDILTEPRPDKAIQTLSSADFYPQILLFDALYHSSILTGYNLIKAFYENNDYLTTTIAVIVEEQALEDQIAALQNGMTFTLAKPLSLSLLLPLLDQAPFRPLPLPYKILVIDDDPDICQYILKILKYSGLKIITIQETQNLENLLKDEQPDLIFLDVNLIDETGVRVLEKIRQQLGYHKLLIGMLTVTQQDTSLIQKCYEADIDEILFKPLEGGLLQRKVASLLKKQTEKILMAEEKDRPAEWEDTSTLKHYLHLLQPAANPFHPSSFVIFEIENFASFNQKMKKSILTFVAHALEDLLKKYDMAAYLEKGRFALVFQGYGVDFIQFFMRAFLQRLYSCLKEAVIKDKPFHLNEVLMVLSTEKSVDAIFKQSEKLLEKIQKEQSDQEIRLLSDESLNRLSEVLIFHDESTHYSSLKAFFEDQAFKVTLFSKSEDVNSDLLSSSPFPLVLLTGSWATARGLQLLKKLFVYHQLQIPILYFSNLPEKDHLQRLLAEAGYFAHPFGMVIIIENLSEDFKDPK